MVMSDAIPLRTQPLESPTLRRRRSSDDREAPLLTPIPSVAESAPAAAPRRCSWKYFLCGTPHRAAFCCTVAVAITLAVVLPLVFCVVVPRVVDRMIAASTLTVVCGSLGPATADSLVVAVTVRLDNAGPFGASLSVFNAAVYGPATPNTAAQPIGTMAFPELLISPSAATHLSITSLLKVSSAEAFRAATIPILRGDGADWEVRGAATVSVGALRVPVYVTKTLRMPATSVDEMTSSDAALEKGDGSSGVLSVSADASFISTSVLELHGLGDLVVELWYDLDGVNQSSPTASLHQSASPFPSDASAAPQGLASFYAPPFPSAFPASAAAAFFAASTNGPLHAPSTAAASLSPLSASPSSLPPFAPGLVRMGTVRLHAFELRKGLNRLRMTIHLDASIGEHAQAAIGSFIGRWISGLPQRIHTRGPVGYPASYLNMVSQVECAVEAIPRPLFTGALMSSDHTVHGWDRITGAPCSTFRQQSDECSKGTLVYAQPPGSKSLLFHNLTYDTFFDQPLSYSATIRVHAGAIPIDVKTVTCLPSDKFARLRSVPGIWAFAPYHNRSYSSDPLTATAQRLADATIPLEGKPVESAFFLAAEPLPGQAEETNADGQTGPCLLGSRKLDPFDCCFTTRFTAAACAYRARGQHVIPVTATGNATIVIDDWSLPARHFTASVSRVPVGFSHALTDFRVGISGGAIGEELYLGFTCDDIEIL